jgi:hypothetical protein
MLDSAAIPQQFGAGLDHLRRDLHLRIGRFHTHLHEIMSTNNGLRQHNLAKVLITLAFVRVVSTG